MEEDMTKNGALGLVFPRRQSLNHGGYERFLWLRISTRKTETLQRNAEVVLSWGRSRHRAENEDVVCGGSRKWSCRETTAMVAPVLVAGGRRKPRRNWRARTWQRRRSGDLEC
ncbi:hypothetical protein F2Q70_00013275 [Brassica cretica]|uniref:Uncharacterized protein n=1 Tax=Brassica cretica TaxID=69181 RepID=A0A8S9G3Q9_BRACR|nr:hypothetical protein F2Q68_00030948 [Brassica cretica]KAF2610091.1 hypothetical protein F2Q70_00013275 [Brassica cretica]